MLKGLKSLFIGIGAFLILIPGVIGLIAFARETKWKELKIGYLDKISGIAGKQERTIPTKEVVNSRLSNLSVPFIPNEGQFEKEVKFKAPLPSGSLFITDESIVYSFVKREKKGMEDLKRESSKEGEKIKVFVFKEKFADRKVKTLKLKPEGKEEAIARVSFFKGNDPKKWKSGLSTYNEVSLGEIYKGIEVRLRASGRNVEKVFCLEPGAKPEEIKIEVEGAEKIDLNSEGELLIESGAGNIVLRKPSAYQEIEGKRYEVEVNYKREGERVYGFNTGEYRKDYPLIIDPQINLFASTFLGGSGQDCGSSIALDSSGNIYVTGMAYSSDFPTIPGAYDETPNGYGDVFISKLNSSLTSLLASTFLGGSSSEVYYYSIALDSSGNVYVTGKTNSSDFPTTPGAFDTTFSGSADAFISKLNNSLTSLLASTFLGGNGGDESLAIKIDTFGNVYVTGYTNSSDFPTTPGVYDTTINGGSDAFISKFKNSLDLLLASTFLGGSSNDAGYSIAFDSSGNIYVTGNTYSSNFPTRPGAFDTTYNGGSDAFISGLTSSLSSLFTSTFLGGSSDDGGYSITLDSLNNVYVTGETYSSDFPVTAGSFDTAFSGPRDAYISKFNDALTSLLASTFLGGSSNDTGYSIALESSGNVYVTGKTQSSDFPTTEGSFDTTYNGGWEAFISKLNSSLISLLASTFLGGSSDDYGYSLALDSSGNVYVTGFTGSSDFPTTEGAFDTYFNFWDAFISNLSTYGFLQVSPGDGLSSSGPVGGPFSPTSKDYTLENTGGENINWSASADQTWVSLSSTGGTLNPSESTVVTVSINSNANSLPVGTYNATLSFNNITNGNGNTTRPVVLTVVPQGYLSVTPGDGFSSSGPVGGPFSPPSKNYTLQNTGGSTINWTASQTQSWVSLSSTGGTLNPSESIIVTVYINSDANGLPAGNYSDTVTFTNTTNGQGNTTRPVNLTVSQIAGGNYLVLPEVIWAPATGGGEWVSEVQITDLSGGSSVQAYFNYGGGSRRGPINLWTNSGGAGRSVKYSNLLSTLQSLDPSFTYYGKVGSVEFQTQDINHRIQVVARTLNGNYSKTFPGLNDTSSNTADTSRSLMVQNVVSNATYRTFIGCFNPSDSSVTVEFKIYDSNGTQIGNTITKTFTGKDFQSFNLFSEAGKPYPTYSHDNAWVKVVGVSGSGRVMVFGATANNYTNDPAAHIAVQTVDGYDNSPTNYQVLPEVIWASATGGGEWVSEVQIVDLSGGSQVQAYFNYGGGSRRGPITLWTNSGGSGRSVKYSNLLSTLQSLDPSFTYYGKVGSVEFLTQDSNHKIQVVARTLNGNYSKTFPGLNDNSSNTADTSRSLTVQNVVSNATYRTFIGCFNPSDSSVTVEFRIYDSNGTQIGNTITKTFTGKDFQSFNLFLEAGRPYPTYSYDNAWVKVTGVSGSGRVMVFGATANNYTNDPAAHIAVRAQ